MGWDCEIVLNVMEIHLILYCRKSINIYPMLRSLNIIFGNCCLLLLLFSFINSPNLDRVQKALRDDGE
jgi:hypothetical protein